MRTVDIEEMSNFRHRYFLLLLTMVSVVSLNSPTQASDYENWSDDSLCLWGTTSTNGIRVFRSAFAGMPEVKKRGLSCDVGSRWTKQKPKQKSKQTKSANSPLKTSFISLSKDDRSIVQSKLADLDLYTSSIDGLYGRGTAAALKQYNEQYANVGNLAKLSNAKKLIALILESSEATAAANPEPKDINPSSTVVTAAKQTAKPKTVADIASYFANQDYQAALGVAQDLAVAGDAEAQAYLGKMYADGLGTLQLSKNAHMWFNIASLNGSVEAIEGRNAVATTMSQDAVSEAQDMAVKCIQSNYADCGLLVKQNTAVTAAPISSSSIVNGDVLISNFKDQSSLRRKQLQYALKKLGLYSSAVDGLWGGNTSRAFTNYIKINEIDAKDAEEVFVSILSKVDVPSSFTPPKKKQNVIKHTTKNDTAKETPTTRSGWTATSQNPKLTFEDARDICEAKAIAAGNSYLSANKPIDRYSSIDCTGYGFNSYSCSRSSGGGVAGGILRAWDQADNRNAAEKLAKAVAKACMADYGWIKK